MSSDEETYAEEDQLDGTFPVQCSALRKGGFMMLNKTPCRIVDFAVCSTGKHGRGKIRLADPCATKTKTSQQIQLIIFFPFLFPSLAHFLLSLSLSFSVSLSDRFTGLSVFDNSKHEGFFPSTHKVPVPNVSRTEFQVVNVSSDGFVSVLTEKLQLRSDIKVPTGDLGEEIIERFDNGDALTVTLFECLGRTVVIGVKTDETASF